MQLEFGPDGFGVGVAKIVEHVEGVAPGGLGDVGVAGGVLGVSEPGKGAGFVVAVV